MINILRNAISALFLITLAILSANRLAAQQPSAAQQPPVPVYTNDAPARLDTPGADQSPAPDNSASSNRDQHPADGRRNAALPAEAYAVAPGTKFLVRLDDDLSTKSTEENHRFRVTTLEPLEAGSGIYLPAGAEIEGRVTRVESAGMAGHAKLYLTFDYLRTRFGKLPIVAEVSAIPGDHSAKSSATKEGVIEGRSSTQEDAAEAAALAAALGAVKGVKDKDKKEAAEGAVMAAFTAYLAESGRGHELNFQHGVKLELELERALYLLRE